MKKIIVTLNKRSGRFGLLLAIAIPLVTNISEASLIGDQINYTRTNPAGDTDFEALNVLVSNSDPDVHDLFSNVGCTAGVFFTYMDSNISEASINITMDTSEISPCTTSFTENFGAESTIVYDDLNWLGAPDGIISGIAVSISGTPNLTENMFSFTNNSITLQPTVEIQFTESTNITIDISTSKVPEPSIIALFAAGFLGLGFARRKVRT